LTKSRVNEAGVCVVQTVQATLLLFSDVTGKFWIGRVAYAAS